MRFQGSKKPIESTRNGSGQSLSEGKIEIVTFVRLVISKCQKKIVVVAVKKSAGSKRTVLLKRMIKL